MCGRTLVGLHSNPIRELRAKLGKEDNTRKRNLMDSNHFLMPKSSHFLRETFSDFLVGFICFKVNDAC